jgi:hypothetical protein
LIGAPFKSGSLQESEPLYFPKPMNISSVFLLGKKTVMKKIIFGLMLVTAFSFVQRSTQLTLKDIAQSIGEWKGTITYLDYSTGKPFTMAANTTLFLDTINGEKIILKMVYPKEPKANGYDTLQVKGPYLDNKGIINIERNKDGITITTVETDAVDGNDNKPCIIKHIYTFEKEILLFKKEVLFKGKSNWILRNEYSFKR